MGINIVYIKTLLMYLYLAYNLTYYKVKICNEEITREKCPREGIFLKIWLRGWNLKLYSYVSPQLKQEKNLER